MYGIEVGTCRSFSLSTYAGYSYKCTVHENDIIAKSAGTYLTPGINCNERNIVWLLPSIRLTMKIPFRFNLKQKKAEQQAAQAPPPASVPTTAAKAEPKQTEVLVG